MARLRCHSLVFSVVIAGLITLRQSAADVVLDWNSIASDTFVNDVEQQNPGMASRTMAMLNVAIYDSFALTRKDGRTFYDYGASVAKSVTASSRATAVQAAYTVLSSIYPAQTDSLGKRLTTSLKSIPTGHSKSAGIELGNRIGKWIVSHRASDGYDSSVQYTPSNEVGRWRPDPLNPDQEAWGPDWGNVRTFALESNTQHLPPAMPALTSKEYAQAFNDVKTLGVAEHSTRTADQTEIGIFWAYDRVGMGTPMRLYNQALRNIAAEKGTTELQNAEMFAKASVAAADAGIVAWNAKFEYDLWRPVSGIREAHLDGNPYTEADPDWVPLGAPGGDESDFTPPFPTYISGHATFGAAIFESVKEFFGKDEISFTLTSDELPGVVRSFDSLTEAMEENGRSRVYLGIHWNFDDTMGQLTGKQIAQHISSNPFTAAVPEPYICPTALLVAMYYLVRRRARFLSA